MKKEVLRLENIFAAPYLSGMNLDIYEGEFDALISLDYIGLDYMLNMIQKNTPIHYGRVFYCEKRVNDEDIKVRKPNKVVILSKVSALIDTLSVAENLFVIRNGYRKYLVNTKQICSQTQQILTSFGVTASPKQLVATLSPCDKWILELAKAWISGVKLVILQGISNFVTNTDFQRILQVINLLTQRNMSFLYVCNHHQEAFQFCTRCFLMKHGRLVKALEKPEMTDEIISHYNYDFDSWVHSKRRESLFHDNPQNEQEGFYCNIDGISFSLKKGETGILLDQDSLFIDTLFTKLQTQRLPKTQIRVNGKQWIPQSRTHALVPSHPDTTLLFPHLSVIDNLCFSMDYKIRGFWLSKKNTNVIAQDMIPILGDAVYESSIQNITTQERYDIVYHRILLQNPSFVCVMQPLASIDQHMRLRLLSYFDTFRKKGITVCILAYTLSDSLEVADRLFVIQNGSIKDIYTREGFPTYQGVSGSRPLKT